MAAASAAARSAGKGEKPVDSMLLPRAVLRSGPCGGAGGGGSALTGLAAKSKRRMASDPTDLPCAAGAGALSRGDADRQRPRRQPARARRPRRRRRPRGGGHPPHPQAPGDPRHPPRRGLVPYHDHNGAAQRPRLLAALAEGRSVALVSDAGTPARRRPRLAPRHRGDRRRPRRHRRPRRLGARSRRWRWPASPPTASSSPGFLAPAPGRPPPRRSPSSPRSPRPSSSTNPPAASPPASPTWPTSSAPPAPPRSAASSPSASRRPAAAPLGELAAPLCRRPGGQGRGRGAGRRPGRRPRPRPTRSTRRSPRRSPGRPCATPPPRWRRPSACRGAQVYARALELSRR